MSAATLAAIFVSLFFFDAGFSAQSNKRTFSQFLSRCASFIFMTFIPFHFVKFSSISSPPFFSLDPSTAYFCFDFGLVNHGNSRFFWPCDALRPESRNLGPSIGPFPLHTHTHTHTHRGKENTTQTDRQATIFLLSLASTEQLNQP